jgi:glycosyltransferase involved in cell wall biosynthesis
MTANAAAPPRIPNIYHFVFGLKPQIEPFHLLHYLCLTSCAAVNKPERIILHLRNEPWGELWDLIRPKIEIALIPEHELEISFPYQDETIRTFSYAHVSDFIRLRALHEQGGIYADMDTLFIAPPPPELFSQSCVMGRERVDVSAPSQPEGSLCNAYIMAEPQAPFIAIWRERMPEAFDGSWSNHSTFLPYRLSLEFPDLIRVEPENRFFAFDWTSEGVKRLFELDCEPPPEAVSLHLWAHLWWDAARTDFSAFNHTRLTPDYVAHAPTTYARLARRFLPRAIAPSIPSPWRDRLSGCDAREPDGLSMSGAQEVRTGRTVLLTHIVPDPNGVGLARRAWRWATELADGGELEILLVSPHQLPPLAYPLPGVLRFIPLAGAPLSSHGLADWMDPDRNVAEILSGLPGPPPDRIVVFRFYLHDIAAWLPPEWRRKAEIDCDDWEAATRWSMATIAFRRGDLATAWRRLREAARYARLERAVLRSYARVHVSAFDDVRRLRQLTGARNIDASPNKIVAEAGLRPPPLRANSRMLLFVGALFYPPNEDAMRWFGAAVLPALRRLKPDVRIVAAGLADERLQRQLARDGIEYVHAPADLAPLYAEAAAVIAPLRGGGGTKLKVLEAWQHERPLVATSHAIRGVAAQSGRHALIADKPRDFARACALLLEDKDLAARLAREGGALVRELYWKDAPPRDLAPPHSEVVTMRASIAPEENQEKPGTAMDTRPLIRFLEYTLRILMYIFIYPVALFIQRKKVRKLSRRVGFLEDARDSQMQGHTDLERRIATLEAANTALDRKLALLERGHAEQ